MMLKLPSKMPVYAEKNAMRAFCWSMRKMRQSHIRIRLTWLICEGWIIWDACGGVEVDGWRYGCCWADLVRSRPQSGLHWTRRRCVPVCLGWRAAETPYRLYWRYVDISVIIIIIIIYLHGMHKWTVKCAMCRTERITVLAPTTAHRYRIVTIKNTTIKTQTSQLK